MQPISKSQGLTSLEAETRLAKFGPNEPSPSQNRSAIVQLLVLFLNPLVLILLIAAAASALLGGGVDASIIVVVVAVGVAINFAQTYRSSRAAERLREQVAPTATVLHDGKWRQIPRRMVVPGDLIQLSAGDMVPADAHLIESRDLYVHQAALTGESMPAEKEATVEPSGANHRRSGPPDPNARNLVFLGTSIVSGTAIAEVVATGAGTAFGDVVQHLAARQPDTEFERGLRHFGGLILRTVFFLVLFILILSIGLHRDPLQSLLFAVALAVGLTPEFLPMITSVTLAKGAVAMSREKVIVKQLAAIQNLGSIDVLCSDKTGTLTTGDMALEASYDALGVASQRPLMLAWLNSQFETGIRSPLDTAILKHQPANLDGYEKRDEVPFDFERRRVSIVVDTPDLGEDRILITKGAPEGILTLAASYEAGGQVLAIGDDARRWIQEIYDASSAQGYRVLAVAYRSIDERSAYSAADEHDLTLAGFLTFADPPVADAREVLEALSRDGVQVKIITGDSDLVARHVCDQVGFDHGQVVVGEELNRTSDAALGHVVENASVFARISPPQKTRILVALKQRGHIVGFMGDGINDAPSLRVADVGISVCTAVDVARDAAGIILVEPGLRVLHKGIIEGRKAFGNVTKYILMGTSSNFGNMFSMAGASVFLPFLPMLPTQILLNNFLYDMAQITIPSDNVDEEYVRGPHRWDIRLIRKFMLIIGPISSLYDFLTFFVLLHFLRADEAEFHTGWFVESLATQTLVLFVIRTMRSPWMSRPSRALTATTIAIALIGLLLPYTPVAAALGFTRLPGLYFAFLAPATVTYLLLVEIVKRRLFPTGAHQRHTRPTFT
jgi:Mg2+-importing ATPase